MYRNSSSGPLKSFKEGSLGAGPGDLQAFREGSLGRSPGKLHAFKEGSLGNCSSCAAAGTGEYFSANGVGEYFSANGLGEYFSANGLGAADGSAEVPGVVEPFYMNKTYQMVTGGLLVAGLVAFLALRKKK